MKAKYVYAEYLSNVFTPFSPSPNANDEEKNDLPGHSMSHGATTYASFNPIVRQEISLINLQSMV